MINNDIHDNQNELGELKLLLFEDEIEILSKLEKKIEALQLEVNDSEQIINKITPLFDDVLLNKFKEKDARTLEIYAEYLADIVQKSTQKHLPELSRSLQMVISPAISKEIADNKETMIDALYPIMGGMISKYVTQAIKEMMETINAKIEDGLSFDKVKRKAKAKITGVSETELLLEESFDATVSAMFVIQKKSGLLIAEAHLEDKEINEPHMVASMASAIKDFINDWVKSNTSEDEIQMLSYGNATLYIESAGSVYIIAFLDIEPNHEQRNDINDFFASLVKKYATFFKHFDGDDSKEEIKTISQKMQNYLNAQVTVEKKDDTKNKPVKILMYMIGFFLMGYVLYALYTWYTYKSIEDKVYEQTGEKIHIVEQSGHLGLEGKVASIDAVYKIEDIIKNNKMKIDENNLQVPLSYIDNRIKKNQASDISSLSAINKNINSLESKFYHAFTELQNKVIFLEEALKKEKNRFNETFKQQVYELNVLKEEKKELKELLVIEEKINLKLDKTFKDNPLYNKNAHALDFHTLKLFSAGNVNYNTHPMIRVSEVFGEYVRILAKYKVYISHIIIEGHSDSSGSEAQNMALSKERALVVKKYLQDMHILEQNNLQIPLITKAYGSSKRIVKNGIEDKVASRRIEIKYELKNSVILKKLRTIIHD